MYISYYEYLLDFVPGVLESLEVPAEVRDEVLKEIKTSYPQVEESPDRHQTKGSRVSIGSPLALRVSNLLKKRGIIILPYLIAKGIQTAASNCKVDNPESEALFSIRLGNEVFLNGEPSAAHLKQFIEQRVFSSKDEAVSSLSLFLARASKDLKFSVRDFFQAVQVRFELLSSFSEFTKLLSEHSFSPSEHLVLMLNALSNEEFDITKVCSGFEVQDDPLALWRWFDSILSTEVHLSGPSLSRNPYAKPASHLLLEKAIEQSEALILEFRYLELQAFLRKKPELLWKRVFEVVCSLRALWNDPWGREALSSRVETSESERVKYLRAICSYVLFSWGSYSDLIECGMDNLNNLVENK